MKNADREQTIAAMRDFIPKCECPAAKRPTEFDCAFPACVGEAVQISTELLVQALALMEAQECERDALREIVEIYAGMDGFIPETALEGYQQQVIKQMYDVANSALMPTPPSEEA